MDGEVRLFAYGTLEAPDLLRRLTGHDFGARPATLEGFARYRVSGRHYPAITADPGSTTPGTLYTGLAADDLARLDRYEGPEFERRCVRVRSDGAELEAWTYAIRPQHQSRLSPDPWDREAFLSRR